MNAVGIDLGGTNLRAAVVSDAGKILRRVQRPLVDPKDAGAILEDMVSLVEELRSAGSFGAIGVGAAGPLDHREGVMYSPPNLPGLKDVALAGELEAGTGLPVFLENDANAAVYGEYRAGPERAEVFLGLTLGTGVGGGIVLEGEPFRGPDGTAAELGHIVVQADGLACPCGNRGCLEMYGSATATEKRYDRLLRDAGKPPREESGTEAIYARARGGDDLAREALETTGRWLGVGIASLVNVFNPDAVVLLGGLAGAHPVLLPPLLEEMRSRAMAPARDRVRIEPGVLGGDAGVVGAALLALKRRSG